MIATSKHQTDGRGILAAASLMAALIEGIEEARELCGDDPFLTMWSKTMRPWAVGQLLVLRAALPKKQNESTATAAKEISAALEKLQCPKN